jgi:hypothetical protein
MLSANALQLFDSNEFVTSSRDFLGFYFLIKCLRLLSNENQVFRLVTCWCDIARLLVYCYFFFEERVVNLLQTYFFFVIAFLESRTWRN